MIPVLKGIQALTGIILFRLTNQNKLVLLDTHIWLWWLLGDGALKPDERKALDGTAERGEITISWVTIWETEMLERKGRITLEPNIFEWMKIATTPEISKVIPVNTDVVLAQRQLPKSFHSDPADRLITSTSILTEYPLATYDQRILKADCCKFWSV